MTIDIKKLNKGFWQVADPKIWVASTVPLLLSVFIALAYGKDFSLFWMILSFVGVYLIEIGKNAVNESVDYITGADTAIDEAHRTPFSGGKKSIIDGLLTVQQSAIIGAITFSAAGILGVVIVLFREPSVIYVGVAGVGLALLYSLPPFKLCYRGLGELAVGIAFGPLIMIGMYLVLTNKFDILPVLVSIPVAFLITNVLWINQFPDYEADRSAGKRNWVVRMGKKKAVYIYATLFILTYISIVILAFYTNNIIWLVGLVTIPLAYKATLNCYRNTNDIKQLIFSNDMTVKIYMLNGILLSLAIWIDGVFSSIRV